MFKEKSRFFRVGQWGYFSRYNDFRVGGGGLFMDNLYSCS